MIELRALCADNIEEVMSLQVSASQGKYVETNNLKSFADAFTMRNEGIPVTPLAIYHCNEIVGFIMYMYDVLDHESFKTYPFYNEKTYFIWHMMIAKRDQGKSYGKTAFEKALQIIDEQKDGAAKYISLFYHHENRVARNLYISHGFKNTGIIQGHSVMAMKTINE